MVYNEKKQDLFTVDESYALAHCISADFALGAGIAVEFKNRFNMKAKLREKYPGYGWKWREGKVAGDCILEGRVLNLITKECYWHKPTYSTMRKALETMRHVCINNGITKIAMPVIGCGLDRLKWDQVSAIIKEVFANDDIEILVCIQ